MSRIYKERPSVLFGIRDDYLAFCFDEACAFIEAQIKSGKTPRFVVKYKSFSEMYSSFMKGG